jgi:hypothetical protein
MRDRWWRPDRGSLLAVAVFLPWVRGGSRRALARTDGPGAARATGDLALGRFLEREDVGRGAADERRDAVFQLEAALTRPSEHEH